MAITRITLNFITEDPLRRGEIEYHENQRAAFEFAVKNGRNVRRIVTRIRDLDVVDGKFKTDTEVNTIFRPLQWYGGEPLLDGMYLVCVDAGAETEVMFSEYKKGNWDTGPVTHWMYLRTP